MSGKSWEVHERARGSKQGTRVRQRKAKGKSVTHPIITGGRRERLHSVVPQVIPILVSSTPFPFRLALLGVGSHIHPSHLSRCVCAGDSVLVIVILPLSPPFLCA